MAFGGQIKKDLVLTTKVARAKFQSDLSGMEASVRKLDMTVNKWAKRTAIAMAAVGAAFVAFGKSIIGVAAEVEQFQIQLNVMYKSAVLGAEKLRWAMEAATRTPFQLPEIIKATVQLKAFGLEAERWLTTIGDLAAGMAVPLEQVTMVFGRIKAGQFGEAMEQLRRMGISAPALIAEGIKFTGGGQIVSSISDVLLGVERVVQDRFKGLMSAQMETMAGTISNLKDWWYRIRLMLSEEIFGVIKSDLRYILDKISEWSKSGALQDWAKNISKWMKNAYEDAKALAIALLKAGRDIWDAIKPWANLFMAHAEGVVKTVLVVVALQKALSIALQLKATMAGIGLLQAGTAAAGAGTLAGIGMSIPALAGIIAGVMATGVITVAAIDLYGRIGERVHGPIAKQMQKESRGMFWGGILGGQPWKMAMAEALAGAAKLLSFEKGQEFYRPIGPIPPQYHGQQVGPMPPGPGLPLLGVPTPLGDWTEDVEEKKERHHDYLEEYGTLAEDFRVSQLSEEEKIKEQMRQLNYDYMSGNLDDFGTYASAMMALNEQLKQAELAAEKIKMQKEETTRQKRLRMLMEYYRVYEKHSSAFLAGDISLLQAWAATGLNILGQYISSELKAEAMKYAEKAGAAAIALDPRAVAYAAAAAALGLAATAATHYATELAGEFYGETGNAFGAAEGGTTAATGGVTGSDRRYGSLIMGQEMTVVISPTVIFQSNESILIGDHTVEEMTDTIGAVCVDATKNAIENGEIEVGARKG